MHWFVFNSSRIFDTTRVDYKVDLNVSGDFIWILNRSCLFSIDIKKKIISTDCQIRTLLRCWIWFTSHTSARTLNRAIWVLVEAIRIMRSPSVSKQWCNLKYKLRDGFIKHLWLIKRCVKLNLMINKTKSERLIFFRENERHVTAIILDESIN